MKAGKSPSRRDRRSFLAAGVASGGTLVAAGAKAQAPARPAKHKVVFELNTPAPNGWDQIFHNFDNIQTVFGADGLQIEAVFFGKGLSMLLKKNTEYAQRLKEAFDKG